MTRWRDFSLPGAARRESAHRGLRVAGGNCSSPPTHEAFVEQVDIVGDAVLVEELVKLLLIDAV